MSASCRCCSQATQNDGSALENVAMWFIGFNLCQTLMICLVGSEFAMRRFGISDSKVGLFVGSCNGALQLAVYIGVVLAFVITFGERDNNLKPYWNPSFSILSIVFILGLDFGFLAVYAISNGPQYLNTYYWLHVLSGFAYGVNQGFAFKVLPNSAPYFGMGVALTGAYVTILHAIVKPILENKKKDIDFWLLTIHIYSVFIIALVTTGCWTIAAGEKMSGGTQSRNEQSGGSGVGFGPALGNAWSAMLMAGIGLGLVYGIFPIISPIMIVTPSAHHRIMLGCLVIEATCGLVCWLLCEKAGMKKSWDTDGDTQKWYWLWLFAPPYLIAGVMFLRILHYPAGFVSMKVRNSVFGGSALTYAFFFSGKMLQNIGYGCCGDHAKGKACMCICDCPSPSRCSCCSKGKCKCCCCCESPCPCKSSCTCECRKKDDSKDGASYVGTFNVCSASTLLVIVSYTSEGYLRSYKSYLVALDFGCTWPTHGVSAWRAFGWWLKLGLRNAVKNIISLFGQDIRKLLL